MWAFLAAASVCAQAQDGVLDPAPLDLRPMMGKTAPTAKPLVLAPRAAPNVGPLSSSPPGDKVAKKPAKKPAPKVAAKPGVKPVAGRVEPLPVERSPGLPTGSIKAPVPVEKAEKAEKPVVAEAPKPVAEARPPFDEYVVAQYCNALSSAASDGRLAWQAKRLEEMEARVRDRIAELEAKRAETADWLKRREEAMKKADESVVAIYSKMKPDAAAAQFSAMDEAGAAAILSKLNPRAAGTVLNEIDASRAARIAAEMAGVGPKREIARSTP